MDVKWIKLSTGIFDNLKIKQIESMPDGDALVVIWLKLLILAGRVNDGGIIYLTKDIPYTDQLLANQFGRPISTIQLALKTFEAFGMIEIVDNVIMVSNWEKYQNVDGLNRIREQTRQRVARHRERIGNVTSNVTCNVTVTDGNETDLDKDLDIDPDKESDKEIDSLPEKRRRDQYKALDGLGEELKAAVLEFIKMRKLIKKPLTDRALKLLISRLNELSNDEQTQIAILNQSIVNSWQNVYPLKEQKGGRLDWIDDLKV